ncbi:MAG: 16S rRNA (cytosine(967)-C(5))-methyltransferase RsmB [Clostridia bacterium]|nr:16S rRNA (cytosine(967)-C(5))-methyltransferase RsmB [Clostridia bacterium]
MDQARKIAWDVLNQCDSSEKYSNLALDTAIKRASLTPADRSLLTALVYGVIEKQITLDACIDRLATRRDGEIAPNVRNLLRLGIYQMAFMDRIPDHAATNETVTLAPKRAKSFVNAVLRAFIRSGKTVPVPPREEDPIRYLSVKYSFCEALCEAFVAEFGMCRAEELFAAFGKQPPLTLRVNSLRITREELLNQLHTAGITAEPTRESPCGIHVLDRIPVTELNGFSEGLFFVQDEASQLCVNALDAREGMTVLDVCACPGSKSFGAAMDMQNCGRVIACDLHANKLSLVKSGAERLGISILQTEARDARTPNGAWIAQADRVLCDVPCSGFGVFAKKPELRYKDPAKSAALPDIQLAILKNASAYVRPGGRLVYSTCTLLSEENGHNVSRFLAADPSFSLVEERTLFPDIDGTDGFFYAVMERTNA